MAVVSLSRIQVRRGKTNGQPLPQLASGELAWAIDTQELYIGNGTTAEGAPEIGNTRVLTERDNIFENYQYKNLPDSKERSLQDRLDDFVTLKSFAINGVSDSVRLQNAIDNLFKDNRFTTQAIVLYVEPGTYNLTDTIILPPNTRIQGSGIGRTIFKISNNTTAPAFKTTSLTTVEGIINARRLYVDGVTFDVSAAVPALVEGVQPIKTTLLLEGVTESKFSNIEIVGNELNFLGNQGIVLNNLEVGDDYVDSKHNIFENVTIRNCIYAVYSDNDIKNNTWKNCIFEFNTISIFLNNTLNLNFFGSETNTIENCWFDNVAQNAIKLVRGTGNVSRGNKFRNVGNSESGTPAYAVIDFGADFGQAGNLSDNDWFLRSYDLISADGVPYIPEIKGNVIYENKFKFHKIFRKTAGTSFVNFNLYAYKMQAIEVTYQFKNDRDVGDIFKYGKLTIMVNAETGDISFNDQSEYLGNPTYSSNNITFSVEGRNYTGGDNPVDTLVVNVVDLTPNTGDTDFYYSVKYIN